MKQRLTTQGYITLPKMAAMLQVDASRLRKAAKKGQIPLMEGKRGGHFRLSVEKLRQLLLPEAEWAKPEPERPKGMMLVPEAAQAIGVTAASAYLAIQHKKLAATRIHGILWVAEKEVVRYTAWRKKNRELQTVRLQLATLERKRKRLAEMVNEAA